MFSSPRTLSDWLEWIEKKCGSDIELGLDRCLQISSKLDLKKPAPIVVTVAGTNGKGSSVAFLESVWRKAGFITATYTSPHLVDFTERIKVQGQPINDQVICQAFSELARLKEARSLTYFEFITLASLIVFNKYETDVAILEVGLGGRLDAVNIVDPDIALITSIGLDHQSILGNSREEIALEKAGIMREKIPVVCSDGEIPDAVCTKAREIRADLSVLGVDYTFERERNTWAWWNSQNSLSNIPLPSLIGYHQLQNAAGVLQVLDLLKKQLPVSESSIRYGVRNAVLEGRFQLIGESAQIVLDVAHNGQAAETLAAALQTLPVARRTHAIVGMLSTKNHIDFLRPLLKKVDCWHFATLPDSRSVNAETLEKSLQVIQPSRTESYCYSSVPGALTATKKYLRKRDERLVITGSCVTVGCALPFLKEK